MYVDLSVVVSSAHFLDLRPVPDLVVIETDKLNHEGLFYSPEFLSRPTDICKVYKVRLQVFLN